MWAVALLCAVHAPRDLQARIPTSCTEPEERTFAMALDTLSHLPVEALRNSSVLADQVRAVGLVRDTVRPLYGVEKGSMHKRYRYGMYQLPEQVGCLLSELASLPTRLRTFVEVGTWYGWTGLFFRAYLRRLFESGRAVRERRFRSASFGVKDMRTPCVKQLAALHAHDFHRIKASHSRKRKNGTKLPGGLRLVDDFAAGSAFYRDRLAASKLLDAPDEAKGGLGVRAIDARTRAPASGRAKGARAGRMIDLCFIDAEHSFQHVSADVRFFQPICRYLIFHDIVDYDAAGVRTVWLWLSSRLIYEREGHAAERAAAADPTAWDAERGYYAKECVQQAGTNRWNFGLGLISARRLNHTWLDEPPSCELTSAVGRLRGRRVWLPRGYKCCKRQPCRARRKTA